jgi:hypothetical protein
MRQTVANVEVICANPRQVLPRNRPPWRAAVASATGQNRKSLSMPLRPVLPDADIERGRSSRTLATPQAHGGPFPPTGFAAMVETMTPRRFPAPWTAEKIAGGYVVGDANGTGARLPRQPHDRIRRGQAACG